MQEILVDSLQRQSLASYPTMCNHLLNYLSAFISALCDSDCITDDVTSHKDSVTKDLKTALALVFKLLETMINKLCHVEKPSHNLSHEANDEKSTETDTSTVNRDKLRDVCKAFFGHPVLNRCFVIKPEDRKQGEMKSKKIVRYFDFFHSTYIKLGNSYIPGLTSSTQSTPSLPRNTRVKWH